MASGEPQLRERVLAAATLSGMSQTELAESLEMSLQTFRRRLIGPYTFRRGDLLAIAELTGVPIEFLDHGFEGAVWTQTAQKPRSLKDDERRPPRDYRDVGT